MATISRVYSTAGTLSVDQITDGSVRVWIKGLPKANYPRRITWKYKRSTASTYSTWASTTIAKNVTPNASYYYNVGSHSEQRLIPGKTYNFMVSITDTEGNYEYFKKYITADTAAATGSFALSATPSQITATITGLKSVAYYGRCVYSYLDRGYGWELWNQTFIAAGATAPTTITHKFGPAGIYQGETHKVKVLLYTGEGKESPGTLYKTMSAKSVVVPYDSISIPEVNSVEYTTPSSTMAVNWGLSLDFVDRSDETVFTFYVKRQDGTVINAGSVTGWRNKSPYNLSVESWLLDEETVSVYIKATDPISAVSATSPEYSITVSRLFKWDSDKVATAPLNITASEWNRLVNYIDDAAEIYPDYFTPTTDHPVVETDDQVTAVIANKVPICTNGSLHQFDTVSATLFAELVDRVNTAMHDATGL